MGNFALRMTSCASRVASSGEGGTGGAMETSEHHFSRNSIQTRDDHAALDSSARLRNSDVMEIAKLALLCIGALTGYGAILGTVSAGMCPETFTLGRPPFFESWPPFALGAAWGALDLLLPSAFAGVALGLAANFGPRPAIKNSFFLRIIPRLLAMMALIATAGGTAGYLIAQSGSQVLTGPMAKLLPVERHCAFAAVWGASLGSLLALFVSALVLSAWIWRKRAFIEQMVQQRAA